MNLIDERFASLKEQGQTALMPFISVGDPDLATSVDIILELEKAGADMVELGVPYSDPLADGPVIQRSSLRALQHRVTIVDCIRIARQCRDRGSKLPFIIFTYYNPVLQLGLERFFELLRENDVSGIIIPDLPLEENGQVLELSRQYNIHLIPLVAPTSNDRIQRITSQAAGFIYCVSSLGVTGTRSQFFEGIDSFLDTVKRSTEVPIAIGFGISSREQVDNFSKKCDGVVVGSAIVRKIEETLPLLSQEETKSAGLLQIREFVRQLKA
ncbi:tryptophan synthase subunit alpha [Chlamydia abortus]|jgi:tryptophan synthase alpha chain|uniref:Tryptophan synthase alpha chain n=1 Tax=Paenibacillus residui TaxID=629724 RepID=A0ABW3D3N0_9BACL|nr:tryptophan synthase subunit alpha [Aneurinibacillus sp. XH2]SHE11019.1 tryptophan synthase subunit alpha [Chlamydia abortus]